MRADLIQKVSALAQRNYELQKTAQSLAEEDSGAPESQQQPRRPSRVVDDSDITRETVNYGAAHKQQQPTDYSRIGLPATAGIAGMAGVGALGYGLADKYGGNRTLATLAGMFGGGAVGVGAAMMLLRHLDAKQARNESGITTREVVEAQQAKAGSKDKATPNV